MYHQGDKLRAIKEVVHLNSLVGKTDAGVEYTGTELIVVNTVTLIGS